MRSFISLLKLGSQTHKLVYNVIRQPNVFCKAPFSTTMTNFVNTLDEKKSEWLELNDKVYPPQLPGEEPRPAFVCHELLNVKYAPKKMWVAASFVRGMSVDEALKQLASARRKGAIIITRAINEAIEMAMKDHNVEFRTNLWVAESFCTPGLIIKGQRRHAKGRVCKIRYRYSNYYIRLEEGQPPEDYYCKNSAWTGPAMYNTWMEKMRRRRISNSL